MEDNGVENANDPFANPRVEEMQYFENLFETEQQDNFMNVTPASSRVTSPDKVAYLYWNDSPGTTKEEKAIGSSIALKVNAGDEVSLKAWARYEEKTTCARDFNLAALASLLGNTFVTQQGFDSLERAGWSIYRTKYISSSATSHDTTGWEFAIYKNGVHSYDTTKFKK
jgi:hypothetical protein